MNLNNGHIVSSLQWNTSFDRKDKAGELQERLSAWSKNRVQRIFASVFDEMCPADQAWRIHSLELNLGQIAYEELESELALRIRKELTEKLTGLLIHSVNGGAPDLQVLNERTTALSALREFLLKGVMPWYHLSTFASAEELLRDQLANDRSATVNVLWETGRTHADVRKRMALQFSEPLVIKIIEALEPNNASYIQEFTGEVTKTQEKERIVEAGTGVFKRDLYLWILNYLFDERGTVFNRIAFMKSTIRQMAAHHNMRYENLLELIGNATQKIAAGRNIKGDFLLTLQTMLAETRGTSAATVAEADHWTTFEMLLHAHNERTQQKAAFNDLFTGLLREDQLRFKALIGTVMKQSREWQRVEDDLFIPSTEALVFLLLPSQAEAIAAHVQFLSRIVLRNGARMQPELPWKAALGFARMHRTAAFSAQSFLQFCIAALAKRLQLEEAELFAHITEAEVPSAIKSVFTADVYRNLLGIARQQPDTTHGVFTSRAIEIRIEDFARALEEAPAHNRKARLLQRQLVRAVNAHPKQAVEAFIAYRGKEELQSILSLILAAEDCVLLVQHLPQNAQRALAAFRTAIEKLRAIPHLQRYAELSGKEIHRLVLHAAVLHARSGEKEILRFVREHMNAILHNHASNAADAFMRILNGESPDAEIASSANSTISGSANFPEWVQALITNNDLSKSAVAAQLQKHVHTEAFTAWSGTSHNSTLLDFFFSGRKDELQTILRKLQQHTHRVQLTEIFWQCVLSYGRYYGNVKHFLRLLDAAIRSQYDEGINLPGFTQAMKQDTQEQVTLHDGRVLTLKEVFALLEEALRTGSSEAKEQENNSPAELMRIAAEARPAELRRMMAKVPLNAGSLGVLRATGSFREVSLWIVSDVQDGRRMLMDALRMLHDVIAFFAPGKNTAALEDKFWRELWRLLTVHTWNKEDLKKLIRDAFAAMSDEMNLAAHEVISEIRKRNIRLTPLLRASLVECFPVFEVLEERTPTRDASRLKAFEAKGMLDNLTHHLVTGTTVPSWFGAFTEAETAQLVKDLLAHHPEKFLRTGRRELISTEQMRWLGKTIAFEELIAAVAYMHPGKETQLNMLGALHRSFAKITGTAIRGAELQHILFRKLFNAWIHNNWKSISGEQLWNELLWEAAVVNGAGKAAFFKAMESSKAAIPPALLVPLQRMQDAEKKPLRKPQENPVAGNKKTVRTSIAMPRKEKNTIAVKNAGIVLLNTYVPMLFERLQLLFERKFRSASAQNDAVHYLQYVVTGRSKTEESFLPLNKVLCGFPVAHPVTDGIAVTDEQRTLIEGLVRAATGYWPAIGETSIDGFRGNWLVRDGLLSEEEDRWELTVEKRPYDMLINKSPFSFSIIRYPWMEKPLHVTWNY